MTSDAAALVVGRADADKTRLPRAVVAAYHEPVKPPSGSRRMPRSYQRQPSWSPAMASDFDVFLSYHSPDRAAVERLGRQLEERGLKVWLDVWRLRPGLPWRRELESQIERIGAAAVIAGASGIGPWQDEEVDALLHAFVERRCPIIPVVLPQAGEAPALPLFLKSRTWVDLRESDPDPLDRLIWGITGEEPPRPTPSYPDDETRELSESLDAAYRRKAELSAAGDDVTEVVDEILRLRRRLRQGAQLKAGDYLLDDRFQLLEPIGQGGFAEVWKAYDQHRRALVAIKVLHAQHARDRSRRQRFFRGARQMAQLAHPNVVRVIEEKCEEGGYHFFVMEYLGGGDLRHAVLDGRLSTQERLQVILQIGELLALAHDLGVIHRDVKPHNILLSPDGCPRLTDFDLVRAADTTGGTRTAMLGTFLYAAPEAMADAKQAAEPADIYGLGMTALFALHGADLPSDVLWEVPELVAGLDIDDRCRDVLLRAVARKVEERWSTVEEFCGALRRALAPESEAAPEPPGAPSEPEPVAAVPSPPHVVEERGHEKDGSVLVKVPAGEFVLGGVPAGEFVEGALRHRVRLSEYWIGKYPVTNEQYDAFVKATGHREAGLRDNDRCNDPRQPVVGVSWQDARAYCQWAGLELPTETQWEAAARGTDERKYPWGNDPPSKALANYRGGEGRPTLVGAYAAGAGPYGTLDQAGNVWEWCRDEYKNDAYKVRDGQQDPWVKPRDENSGIAVRVLRGGSWADVATSLRAASRHGIQAGLRYQYFGFRVLVGFGPER